MSNIYSIVLGATALLALAWAIISIWLDDSRARRQYKNLEQLQDTQEYLITMYDTVQKHIRESSTVQRNYAREIVELKCRIIQLEKKIDCQS